LYYYNVRYYDSELGGFIQADTVLPDMSSQCLNRYSHCANNPLIHTDPSGNVLGLIATVVIYAIVGAAAAACRIARKSRYNKH